MRTESITLDGLGSRQVDFLTFIDGIERRAPDPGDYAAPHYIKSLRLSMLSSSHHGLEQWGRNVRFACTT